MFSFKKTFLLLSVLIFSLTGFIAFAQNATTTPNPTSPKILSVDIPNPAPGAILYIKGENFSNTLTDIKVTLNDLNLEIQHSSTTDVYAVLTELCQPGALIVAVKDVKSEPFDLKLTAPVINYLEFPQGIKKGQTFYIHGANFNLNPTKNEIKFGTLTLKVSASVDNKITAILPNESVDDYLTVKKDEFISNKIKLTLIVTPVIKNLIFQEKTPGSKVTIKGENFHTEDGKNIIKFNDLASPNVTHLNDNDLSAIIPENAASGLLTITINNQVSNPFPYTLKEGPTISLGAIKKDDINKTAKIMVYSPSFTNQGVTHKVYLNNTELKANPPFENQIAAELPAALPAKGTFFARSNGLKGNEIEYDFTANLAPVITKIETSTGFYPSQNITIIGANIDTHLNRQSIGNIVIKDVSEYVITGMISDTVTAGTGISIVTSYLGLSSNTLSFQVGDDRNEIRRLPEIKNLIFPNGCHAGDKIIIEGLGFGSNKNDNEVLIDNYQTAITASSETSIEATIPKTAKNGVLQVKSYHDFLSSAFNFALVPAGQNEKTISLGDVDPLNLKTSQTNLILGKIMITNLDRPLLIKKISLPLSLTKENNIYAFKNLNITNASGSILTKLKTVEKNTTANRYEITFENIDLPVALEPQLFYLKGDLFSFIDPDEAYTLKLENTEADLQIIYKHNNEAVTLPSGAKLSLSNTIENPPVTCVSRTEKDYCTTEVIIEVKEGEKKEENPSGNTETPQVKEEEKKEEIILEKVPFADVPEGVWFNIPVAFLKAKNITKGYADNTFHPNQPITRAEFLKITLLGAKKEIPDNEPKNNQFTDTGGHWAEKYINFAATTGIINGNRPLFEPNKPISRAEAVKILLSAFNLPTNLTSEFQFADTANHWCQTVCQQAKLNNIVQGYEQGGAYYFYPDNSLNRAESAQMIYKVMTK